MSMASFLPMLMGILPSLMGNMGGGKEAYEGSTYNQGQLGANQDILGQIQQLMQKGQGDITQNQGYQQGQDWLSSLFNDPEFFKSFEAPLQRQFQEQTVPDLLNRFAGMGSGGALGSTGLRNQLSREGGNLSSNIAALRGNMQQQGANQQLGYAQQPFSNLMSMYQNALGTPTNNIYRPATAGPLGEIGGAFLGGLSGGFGQAAGKQFANSFGGNNKSSTEPPTVSLG